MAGMEGTHELGCHWSTPLITALVVLILGLVALAVG